MDIVVDDFQERSQELIGGHLVNSRSLSSKIDAERLTQIFSFYEFRLHEELFSLRNASTPPGYANDDTVDERITSAFTEFLFVKSCFSVAFGSIISKLCSFRFR